MAEEMTFNPGRIDRTMAYDDAVFVSPANFEALTGRGGDAVSTQRGKLMTLRNQSVSGTPAVHFFVKCVPAGSCSGAACCGAPLAARPVLATWRAAQGNGRITPPPLHPLRRPSSKVSGNAVLMGSTHRTLGQFSLTDSVSIHPFSSGDSVPPMKCVLCHTELPPPPLRCTPSNHAHHTGLQSGRWTSSHPQTHPWSSAPRA